ncbi:MAG: complex I NDUFA9 subunit family protein, partial [Dongiaceae bacterium]
VGQITPIAANIRDDASVATCIEGSDAVVNLVGILYSRGRQSFEAVHVDGAKRIAAAARNEGASRLIQMSALGADSNSISDYARSKAIGEMVAREAFPGATIVRPSIIFGPEDSFFNRFAAMARISPALPLIGGGKTRFQPVYVGDVAAAIATMLDKPETAGEIYELAGPEILDFRALMERMLAEIGRQRLLLPIPFWAASLKASFLGLLPVPPLTRDQVRLLRSDNVASGNAPGFASLGIEPTAMAAILPTYLRRYRRGARL